MMYQVSLQHIKNGQKRRVKTTLFRREGFRRDWLRNEDSMSVNLCSSCSFESCFSFVLVAADWSDKKGAGAVVGRVLLIRWPLLV